MASLLHMYLQNQGSPRIEEDTITKAQFQQKQMQEKEQKLLQMLDAQQQKALQKAALNGVIPPHKYSNGLLTNINNRNSNNNSASSSHSVQSNSTIIGTGKVRQLFEERRKGHDISSNSRLSTTTALAGYTNGKVRSGIDKSYPLEPLMTRSSPTPSNVQPSRSNSSKSDPATTSSVPSNNFLTRKTNTGPAGRTKVSSSFNNSSSMVHSTSFHDTKPHRNIEKRMPNSSSSGHLNNDGEEDGGIFDVPTTTKYSDYVASKDRDSVLSNKLKRMNLSEESIPLSAGSNGSRSSSYGRVASNKSSPGSSPAKKPGMPVVNRASNNRMAKTPTVKTTPAKKPPSTPPPGLEGCKICGRFFAPDRIAKHETICKKTTTKKRKVFDPTKMRMQGTDAEPYLRKVSASKNKKEPPKVKKADWRKQHENFIETIRAAKIYQQHVAAGGNPADLPPPPPTDTSDYIQCPHCGRRFNEAAAERHIPKCKNIKSNKR